LPEYPSLEEIQKENMEVFKNFGLAAINFSLDRKADEKLTEFIEKHQDHFSIPARCYYVYRH